MRSKMVFISWSLAAGCVLALLAGLWSVRGVSQAAPQVGPIYVDANAPGIVQDGASWGSAYTNLQAALDSAAYGAEIWVAQGVYTPTYESGRTATFWLRRGVALYGGFGGHDVGETTRSQRNWQQYVTVLSGDLEGNDLADPNGVLTSTSGIVGQNAYHVVASREVTETAVLDGFTITGGDADGAAPHDLGGGLLNIQANPTLANLVFSGNSASQGGGLYNTLSDLPFYPAVYVSTAAGLDSNPGSQVFPKKTIAAGIDRASALRFRHVRIQAGNYPEVVVMRSGINLQGGYSAVWSWGDYTQPAYKVQITGGLYSTDSQYLTVIARNLTQASSLMDVVLVAPNVPGPASPAKSSYGVVAINSNELILQRLTIQAGNGAAGMAGTGGISAVQTPANSGGAGEDAFEGFYVCNDTDFGAGGPAGSGSGNLSGGAGGNGGKMDTACFIDFNPTAGLAGTNAALAGAGYGTGGAGGAPCAVGLNGSPGKVTVNGNGGSAAGSSGSVINFYWVSTKGGDGGLGQDGSGGGGGGGSGGCDIDTDSWGAGGGGGGAGGLHAPSAGTSGFGGGASFGVFAVSSTVQAQDVTITRGNGGDGGSGGDGGLGQPGGSGGPGGAAVGDSLAGGTGGNGSRGGNSGGGAGGNGGNSYGVYDHQSTVNLVNVSYSGGAGGSGGPGGSSPTSPGGNGSDGSVFGLVSFLAEPPESFKLAQAAPQVDLPVFTSLVFSGNSAISGAGLYNHAGACLKLANGLFTDNHASSSGGGLYNQQSNCLTLVNVTLAGNSAVALGGGFYNQDSAPLLQNSILWSNSAPVGAQIANSNNVIPSISYCDIQASGGSGGGWDSSVGVDGGSNIDADPLFINFALRQLGLIFTSPARNAGSNGLIAGFSLDLAGGPRILDGNVDMGAYEQLWLPLYLPVLRR